MQRKPETMINVTSPYLPKLGDYVVSLADIFERKQLTNNGKYCQLLEQRLTEYLGVPYVSLTCNGTMALMIACKALGLKGGVITSPFTFAATVTALKWIGLNPVFVDIDEKTWNINHKLIIETAETSAILPVNVFGNPAFVRSDKNIIYDGCHSFGVKQQGKSILNYGNLSVLSFHATKIFTTFEGGAIISHDKETYDKINLLRNFGIVDEETQTGEGINGKMCEAQAAFGLLQLNMISEAIEKRKIISQRYDELLYGYKKQYIPKDVEYNYSYYPILVDNRNEVYDNLLKGGFHARKYFYPLVCDPQEVNNFPVAKRISEQILCLPIYPDLELSNVDEICKIICKTL